MIDRDTGWYFVPASVKAVVVVDGRVLLCRNARNEWELPGGWPQKDDRRMEDTVEREVLEESGLRVKARDLLCAGLLAVGGHPVMIVALRAVLDGAATDPVASAEHTDVRFFGVDRLPGAVPGIYAEAIRRAVDRPLGSGDALLLS